MKGKFLVSIFVVAVICVIGYFVINKPKSQTGLGTGEIEEESIPIYNEGVYIGENLSNPVIADLDYDGHKEIVLTGVPDGSYNSAVIALDIEGNYFFDPFEIAGEITNPVTGIIKDADINPVIIAASLIKEDGTIHIYWINHKGELAKELIEDKKYYMDITDPVFVDVTLDGYTDVIIGAYYPVDNASGFPFKVRILIIDGSNSDDIYLYETKEEFDMPVIISPISIGRALNNFKVKPLSGIEANAVGRMIFFSVDSSNSEFPSNPENKHYLYGIAIGDTNNNGKADINDKPGIISTPITIKSTSEITHYPITAYTPGFMGAPAAVSRVQPSSGADDFNKGFVLFGDVKDGHIYIRAIMHDQKDGSILFVDYTSFNPGYSPEKVLRTGNISYSSRYGIFLAPFLIESDGQEMVSGKLCKFNFDYEKYTTNFDLIMTLDSSHPSIEFFPEEYDAEFLECLMISANSKDNEEAIAGTYYLFGRLAKSKYYELPPLFHNSSDIPKALAIADMDGNPFNFEVVGTTSTGKIIMCHIENPTKKSFQNNYAYELDWPMFRWVPRRPDFTTGKDKFIKPEVNKLFIVEHGGKIYISKSPTSQNIEAPIDSTIKVYFLGKDKEVEDVLWYWTDAFSGLPGIDYDTDMKMPYVSYYSNIESIGSKILTIFVSDKFSNSPADAAKLGPYYIKFKKYDMSNLLSSGFSENQPPNIVYPDKELKVYLGNICEFTVEVEDEYPDEVTCKIENMPEGAKFYPQARKFFWEVSNNIPLGSYDLQITATDNLGAVSTKTVNIVVAENMPPQIKTPVESVITKPEANIVVFTFSATDPDGDNITLKIDGIPKNATFNQATGQFYWKAGYDDAGTYNLTLQASDNYGHTVTKNLNIVVENAYNKLTIHIKEVKLPVFSSQIAKPKAKKVLLPPLSSQIVGTIQPAPNEKIIATSTMGDVVTLNPDLIVNATNIAPVVTVYFNAGASVTLSAKPKDGYLFKHWSGKNSSTKAKISIIMNKDATLIASFSKKK